MDGFKNDEEFSLGDIIDINFDKSLKLSIVQLFQDIKTSNIERLDKMWWMCREIEGDDILLFTEFFELDWEMVFITI